MRENGRLYFFTTKDPLVMIGITVLALGLILLVYGLIPFSTPHYQIIAGETIQVPVSDPQGNIFTPDSAAAYAATRFTGLTPDQVQCVPDPGGWSCSGLAFIGMVSSQDVIAQEYGVVMAAVGFASFYLGYRYKPLTVKKRELRSINVRVDEGICIANGVCVELAPKVFQLKKQDTPSLLAPLAYVVDPSAASNDEILQAAQMCPTGAIIIEDAETGERIHPPYPS